jgi:hypothetical protein
MAVTSISTSLSTFNPVYNPIVHIFDSTNKNQLGFRYVVDVYLAGTSTKIYEGRVAPRPTDGYGYIDLSKILANYVSFDVTLSNTTSIAVPNSYIKYDIKIGEEYIVAWPFTDSTFVTGNKTRLNGSSAPTFVAGDQIVVNLTNPTYFPTLVGLQTVDSIDTNDVIIDLLFVSSPTNPGTVSYADGRKTVTRNLLTLSSYTAYNGALTFTQWPSYVATDYQITATSTTKKLLTNIPDNFYAKTTQDIWINWAPFLSSTPTYAYFENSNGDVFRKNVANNTQELRQFSAGPNNVGSLSLVSGTAGLVKTNTTYYDFYITNSSGTQMSKKYRINIDRTCNIEDYEIVFQDRLGSFASFAFDLRSKLTGKIDRETYNRQIGDLVTNKWSYNIYDAGTINTTISLTEEYELNTSWMTNEMNQYFVELLTSPVTYVKINNVYYSCVITDTNYEIQSSKYKKLIKRTIKIKLSNEPIVNI